MHLSVAARRDALSPEQETALYRIVQEALTNVVKHANATTVSIVIGDDDGALRAAIEDDGDGFDTTSIRDGALGLTGMRERILLAGGSLDIQSSPTNGTQVRAELPREWAVQGATAVSAPGLESELFLQSDLPTGR